MVLRLCNLRKIIYSLRFDAEQDVWRFAICPFGHDRAVPLRKALATIHSF